MKSTHRLLGAVLLLSLASSASAQDKDVPYWASVRVDEVNMRVGPSDSYVIAWVFRRKGLPVKVVRLLEGWRLVEDPDGARGWMLGRFLSRDRTAIIRGKGMADMRNKPQDGARVLWRLQPGVSGKLGDCDHGWCHIDVAGHAGFVRQDRLWGAGEP